MSVFEQTSTAKEFEGNPYPIPGIYEAVINRVKEKKDRKGIDMVIVELKILRSNTPERPADSTMDWVVKYDKDAAAGNVKTFFKQALNCWCIQNGRPPLAGKEFTIDKKTWDAVMGEQNFLAGTPIFIEAYNKDTAEGGKFTRMKWGYTEAQRTAAPQYTQAA